MLIEGNIKQSCVETSCPLQSELGPSVRTPWLKGQEPFILCGLSDGTDLLQCVSLFQLMVMCQSDFHHSDKKIPEDIHLKGGRTYFGPSTQDWFHDLPVCGGLYRQGGHHAVKLLT